MLFTAIVELHIRQSPAALSFACSVRSSTLKQSPMRRFQWC